MSVTIKQVAKTLLSGSAKAGSNSKTLAEQGVGSTQEVAAAQAEATMKAMDAIRLNKTNASFKDAQENLAGDTTRYAKAMTYSGVEVVSIDQKDIMIDPSLFRSQLKDAVLPRMVKVSPMHAHWDENGQLYLDGGRSAYGNELVINTSGVAQDHGFNQAWPGKLDTVMGYNIYGKTFNVNRGNGQLEMKYEVTAQGNLINALTLRGIVKSNFSTNLLRFLCGFTETWNFTESLGDLATTTPPSGAIGARRSVKAEAFELKGVLSAAADAVRLLGTNIDIWIRPLILTGTTAPAIVQALENPGVEPAEVIGAMY